MKKIIREPLRECINFGVKKFDFKIIWQREGFEPSVVLHYTRFPSVLIRKDLSNYKDFL